MKKSILIAALMIGVIVQSKAQTVVLDRCEDVKGWSGRIPVTLSLDAKEGKNSLQSEGIADFRFRKVFDNPVNTGLNDKSGYIGFWLFVSDIQALEKSPGVVMISSSGKSDLNAYHLRLRNLNLQNGWNKVVLELSDKFSIGGDFDESNFNYFNLFQKTEIPVILKIDNINFAKNAKDLK